MSLLCSFSTSLHLGVWLKIQNTIVHVAVKQSSMICSYEILLCDMAFKFPEEKHYPGQHLDDFQDMSPNHDNFWSTTKPSYFKVFSLFTSWPRLSVHQARLWVFASFSRSLLAVNHSFACLNPLLVAGSTPQRAKLRHQQRAGTLSFPPTHSQELKTVLARPLGDSMLGHLLPWHQYASVSRVWWYPQFYTSPA